MTAASVRKVSAQVCSTTTTAAATSSVAVRAAIVLATTRAATTAAISSVAVWAAIVLATTRTATTAATSSVAVRAAIFLYLCGYFLWRLCPRTEDGRLRLPQQRPWPVLSFVGRHCLPFYLVHQPAIYGLLSVLALAAGA